DRNVTGVQTCALPILGVSPDFFVAGLAMQRDNFRNRGSRNSGTRSPAQLSTRSPVWHDDSRQSGGYFVGRGRRQRRGLDAAGAEIGRASCRERGERRG